MILYRDNFPGGEALTTKFLRSCSNLYKFSARKMFLLYQTQTRITSLITGRYRNEMWGQTREGASFSKRTWAKNQKTWALVLGLLF